MLFASTLQILRFANLLDELLHEDHGVGEIEAQLCAPFNLQVNIDLAVGILVGHADVENIGKWNGMLAKVKDRHVGLRIK